MPTTKKSGSGPADKGAGPTLPTEKIEKQQHAASPATRVVFTPAALSEINPRLDIAGSIGQNAEQEAILQEAAPERLAERRKSILDTSYQANLDPGTVGAVAYAIYEWVKENPDKALSLAYGIIKYGNEAKKYLQERFRDFGKLRMTGTDLEDDAQKLITATEVLRGVNPRGVAIFREQIDTLKCAQQALELGGQLLVTTLNVEAANDPTKAKLFAKLGRKLKGSDSSNDAEELLRASQVVLSEEAKIHMALAGAAMDLASDFLKGNGNLPAELINLDNAVDAVEHYWVLYRAEHSGYRPDLSPGVSADTHMHA